MSGQAFTDDQLKRIEQNRQRALQLKSKKSTPISSSSNVLRSNSIPSTPGSSGASSSSDHSSSSILTSKFHGKTQSNKQNYTISTTTSSACLSCSLIQGDRFLISCKYNPKLVTAFKSIPSRRYDPETKGWSFDFGDYHSVANKVKGVGYNLSSLNDAVLVKDVQGGSAAVALNDGKNEATCRGTCYIVSRSRFEVDMPYNAACVGIFKSILSKSYNISTRRWSFDLSDYNQLYSLLRKEPDVHVDALSSTVLNVFKDQIAGKKKDASIPECDWSEVDGNIVSSLMPFQKEGVNFAISRNGRILLADDMGLGKTVQSICIASYYRSKWPLLIISPSSVRLMWKEALLRWLPSQLSDDDINVVLTGRDVASSRASVTIISYDLLTKHQKDYESRKHQIVILDESHFIKNFKTARARAATAVLKHAKHMLLLSGTPALSRPAELYTQLFVLRPDFFPRFHQFGLRYCAAKQNAWGWEYTGSSNMDELRLVLQETVMLRRTKDDVLTQLPPKLRRSVAIDVSGVKTSSKQKKAMEEAHNAVEKKGISAVERHGVLLKYFNETAHVKLPAVKSYVFDLLEGGHKFLLFAHHKMVLDSLEQDLVKKGYEYMRVDGNTPSEQRHNEVARFQEKSSCKVALLSITAANMGITLHSASLVVFAELFWNPGILVQAEDRCYRIGQRDVVNVHYLVAKGTADDYIWEMIKKKLEVLSKAGLNKSNFDETEIHVARKQEENNLLHYFQATKSSNSNDVNDNSRNADSCDVTISEEELLKALEEDDDWFVGQSDFISTADAKSTHDASDVTENDCRPDATSRKREKSLEEQDLDAVSEWRRNKRKKKISQASKQANGFS